MPSIVCGRISVREFPKTEVLLTLEALPHAGLPEQLFVTPRPPLPNEADTHPLGTGYIGFRHQPNGILLGILFRLASLAKSATSFGKSFNMIFYNG